MPARRSERLAASRPRAQTAIRSALLAGVVILSSAGPFRPGPAWAAAAVSCQELQSALDGSHNGDVITIDQASCQGNWTLKSGVHITLRGAPGTGTALASGQDGEPVLSGSNVGRTVIRDLQFTGGVASGPGGGLSLTGSVAPTIDRCAFFANASAVAGGGLYVSASPDAPGDVLVEHSIIGADARGNSAPSGGGAFVAAPVGLRFIRNTVAGNSATTGGGAFLRSEGHLSAVANTFRGNSATGQGGGAVVLFASDANLLSNTFRDNQVTAASGDAQGGGLLAAGFFPVFRAARSEPRIIQRGNAFLGNRLLSQGPASFSGGGEYVTGADATSLRDVFVDNRLPGTGASVGAGIGLNGAGGSFHAQDLAVQGNDAGTGGRGGGIGVQGSCSSSVRGTTCHPLDLALMDSTVWENSAATATGALGTDRTILRVRNSIVVGGPGNKRVITGFKRVSAVFTDACQGRGYGSGSFAGTGDVCADPLLTRISETRPVQETAASPTIDVGSDSLVPASLSRDYEGDQRFLDGDGDGAPTVDMGADEFSP